MVAACRFFSRSRSRSRPRFRRFASIWAAVLGLEVTRCRARSRLNSISEIGKPDSVRKAVTRSSGAPPGRQARASSDSAAKRSDAGGSFGGEGIRAAAAAKAAAAPPPPCGDNGVAPAAWTLGAGADWASPRSAFSSEGAWGAGTVGAGATAPCGAAGAA